MKGKKKTLVSFVNQFMFNMCYATLKGDGGNSKLSISIKDK